MDASSVPFEIKEEDEEVTKDISLAADISVSTSDAVAKDSLRENLMPAEDDDDPIVTSFPIYLSSRLASNLHIFQYPVRPNTRPYTGSRGEPVLDLRTKPQSGLIQVDVPINTTQFYDHEKGEKWGAVDRQTLGGVTTTSDGYMIGIFKNGELHLTPVKGTCQLRPSFTYVDKDAQTEKEIARSVKQDPTKPTEIRAVQMTVKSSDDSAPRYSGALAARKRAEDEEYVEMRWYDKDTEDAWYLADQLLSASREPLIPATTKDEYIDLIRDKI
ncbi:Sin-like protein conserved region-domain-containing protein [Lipomyces kononenkoae]|uniref:Sin-like protein conserved region-domain-containing protein n=1 Tax=Lipomyces kononenkoae TaxID=34357 RepID=A0ACC3SUS9_LIPKO